MLEINFGDFPVLKTERLVLRQMNDADSEALFRLRSNPEIMRHFDSPLMQSSEEARLFIERINAMFNANEGIQWTISLLSDSKTIGTITIWKIDKQHHRGEVGYLLDTAYQRQGLMREALAAVLEYGFDTLQIHSMEANVNVDNSASMNLLKRCGFVQEAYFRENFYFNGKFLDTAVYCRLSGD